MARIRVTFVCRSCGAIHPRWMGKCPDCGAWDTLEEHRVDRAAARDPQKGSAAGWAFEAGLGGAERAGDEAGLPAAPEARPIGQATDEAASAARWATGIGEFDRVLGGGLVAGSAALIGGDPGIGKSTLLLQAAGRLAARGARTLYVSSEESAAQVRLRADRLGAGKSQELFVLADSNLARIIEQARRVRPAVMVIDSIQMIYKADVDASPGSVTQLRRCCMELVYLAKASGVSIVLVGHVTKDGALAGPRLLEHMVDAVLYFEGDRYHAHRVLRGVKNRFGTTLEIGLFEMTGAGLKEADPSGWIGGLIGADGGRPGSESRATRTTGTPGTPGSVICPVVTGARCILVEVQALTATGFLGAAKRKSSGLDANRLAMLIAALEQHGGLRLADRDIFASAVGGVRVVEPAADLALCLAIAGAHYRKALPFATAVFGEVGLGGEVRPVSQVESRLREAARLGCKRVIAPGRMESARVEGLEIVRVGTVGRAMEELG